MGRKVNVDNLVGAPEIAERLNLSHAETVHAWRRRYADFPKPVATVAGVHVWNWPDVSRWAKKNNRPRSRSHPAEGPE